MLIPKGFPTTIKIYHSAMISITTTTNMSPTLNPPVSSSTPEIPLSQRSTPTPPPLQRILITTTIIAAILIFLLIWYTLLIILKRKKKKRAEKKAEEEQRIAISEDEAMYPIFWNQRYGCICVDP